MTREPMGVRPAVAIALRADLRSSMIAEAELARLREFADVRIAEFGGAVHTYERPEPDAEAEARLAAFAADADALVVTHGAPRVTAEVLAACPELRFVGELEGDRFAGRIDVDAAAARGVVVVDTTHGSSWPVAEYALAMAVFGLRDSGRYVRALAAGEPVPNAARGDAARLGNRELTGRRVGLVGFGHIAWRLVEFLRPFRVTLVAHDPYVPREIGDALGVSFGSLDAVMSTSDVVICLAPLTPSSRGSITERHLRLLRRGSVFVNVSRGAVVDAAGLEAVASQGEVVFCLDVLDPEPVPVGHPLRELPNVLLTPHLAGTTDDAGQRFFALMVDELHRFAAGLEPQAQLTPRVMAGRHDDGSHARPTTTLSAEGPSR